MNVFDLWRTILEQVNIFRMDYNDEIGLWTLGPNFLCPKFLQTLDKNMNISTSVFLSMLSKRNKNFHIYQKSFIINFIIYSHDVRWREYTIPKKNCVP